MKQSKKAASLLLTLVLCLALTVPAIAAGGTFTDVPASHWAYYDIEEMAARKVVEGLGDGRFNPDGKVAYADFSVMIARLFFADALAGHLDQPKTYWWQPYTDVLMEREVFNLTDIGTSYSEHGEQWDKAAVEAPLNRFEMAQIMNNVLELKNVVLTTAEEEAAAAKEITDLSSIPPQYTGAVIAMYTIGCLRGMDSAGNFRGEAQMSRAQACAVLTRMADILESPSLDDVSERNPGSISEASPDDISGPASAGTDPDLQAIREEMLTSINMERAAVGVGPLALDAVLCQAAQVRAEEAARYFSHTRPDGRSCFTAIDDAGESYRFVGENLCHGQRSVAAAMNSWMTSSAHQANILNSDFGRIGIGRAYTDEAYGIYWTQIFTD